METLIALVSDPDAHVEDRALGMVYQLINQGFDEDSAIAQACACFNLYGLDAITICRAFDFHQKLDSLMEKSMIVQQLLQKLDHRTATRLHCEFINGHCFGDIPRPDSHEDDEFGGWLEEEWLILTGLSAIASYQYAAVDCRNPAEAGRHLPAISKSAKVLMHWLNHPQRNFFVVANDLEIGAYSKIWVYRTTDSAWYVYAPQRIAFMSRDEAKQIQTQYAGSRVISAYVAGKL